jgi:hypothetical protein
VIGERWLRSVIGDWWVGENAVTEIDSLGGVVPDDLGVPGVARVIKGLQPLVIDTKLVGSLRMGARVVDWARLESVCTARYRGFESLPIRQCFVIVIERNRPLSLRGGSESNVAFPVRLCAPSRTKLQNHCGQPGGRVHPSDAWILAPDSSPQTAFPAASNRCTFPKAKSNPTESAWRRSLNPRKPIVSRLLAGVSPWT